MSTYSEGYLRAITDVLHEITREAEKYVVEVEARGLDHRDSMNILRFVFEDVAALGNFCVETADEQP